VDLVQRAGRDVGDINHSVKFVEMYRKSCSQEIEERLKGYFGCRLPQTGQKPKVKVCADSATWKHRTRQVVGLIAVTPDTSNLIKAFYINSCWSPSGYGRAKAKEVVQSTDRYMTGEQYGGMSVDGAYIATHVGEYVAEHYGVTAHDDLDPMHACGTPEAHMRASPRFAFLTKDTESIAGVYKLINFGKEFYNFFQASEQLRQEGYKVCMKLPRFFSETRLPNYAAEVYDRFLENYPVLVRRLAGIQEENWRGSAEDKKKADKAAGLQNRIYNLMFVVTLAGVVDIYRVYRKIVNVVQVQRNTVL
jgi:hypothetical protein